MSFKYAATCGAISDAVASQLDVSVVGFSRLVSRVGFWTQDDEQWPWKRAICAAKRVFFAGTLDKIGEEFGGKPVLSLQDINFTVVADCDATDFSEEEMERVEREREALGERLVLVDEEGVLTKKLKR